MSLSNSYTLQSPSTPRFHPELLNLVAHLVGNVDMRSIENVAISGGSILTELNDKRPSKLSLRPLPEKLRG
jgi:hypothetical protein